MANELVMEWYHPHPIVDISHMMLLFLPHAMVAYAVAYPLLIVLYSPHPITDAHAWIVLYPPAPMKLSSASATILLLYHPAIVDFNVST